MCACRQIRDSNRRLVVGGIHFAVHLHPFSRLSGSKGHKERRTCIARKGHARLGLHFQAFLIGGAIYRRGALAVGKVTAHREEIRLVIFLRAGEGQHIVSRRLTAGSADRNHLCIHCFTAAAGTLLLPGFRLCCGRHDLPFAPVMPQCRDVRRLRRCGCRTPLRCTGIGHDTCFGTGRLRCHFAGIPRMVVRIRIMCSDVQRRDRKFLPDHEAAAVHIRAGLECDRLEHVRSRRQIHSAAVPLQQILTRFIHQHAGRRSVCHLNIKGCIHAEGIGCLRQLSGGRSHRQRGNLMHRCTALLDDGVISRFHLRCLLRCLCHRARL